MLKFNAGLKMTTKKSETNKMKTKKTACYILTVKFIK